MRLSFVDGCQYATDGTVDCRCAFDHITSRQPYDSPVGFSRLAGPVEAARSPAELPPVMIEAIQSCRRPAG